MVNQKYLIKVDYSCPEVKIGGKWFVIKTDRKPKIGTINKNFLAENPLPQHSCVKHYYSQACDDDPFCESQEILEIKPYSEKEAEKLKAKKGNLEVKLESVSLF